MLFALAVGVGFLAGFLQGFSGFGLAIFSMSLLALILGDIQYADRMVVIMASACVAVLAFRLWKHIQWRRLPFIAMGVALGVPVGVLLGPHIPPGPGRMLLGGIIILTGLYRAWAVRHRPQIAPSKPGPAEVSYGVAAGLLAGWVNMSGPPLVYWAHHRFDPMRARALLAGAFIFSSAFKLTSLTVFDLWIAEYALAGLIAMPAVLVGTWLGDGLARRSRPALYAPVIWALFILLGVLLLVSPVRDRHTEAEAASPAPSRAAVAAPWPPPAFGRASVDRQPFSRKGASACHCPRP